MLNAGLAGQHRKTFALRLFPLSASLSCVLNGKDAPDASQRRAQRRLVIEIALDDIDVLTRQCHCPLTVRFSGQTTQTEPGTLERLCDRTALMAGHSRD